MTLIVTLAFFIIDKVGDSIDREIIIKKVLLARQLFYIIIIGSLSLFFISSSSSFKVLPLIYNITLIFYTTIVLRRFVRWFSLKAEVDHKFNYKQQLRINFYSNQRSDNDFLMVWDLVLSDENLKNKNQYGLIDAFINAAGKIKNQDRYQYNQSQLIWQIVSNLYKINFYNPDDYKTLVKYSLTYFEDHYNSTRRGSIKLPHAKRALFLALLDRAISNDDNEIFRQIIFEEINSSITKAILQRKILPGRYCIDYMKDA